MENFIQNFKEYCNHKSWKWDNFTSEFTFQFRLSRFLDTHYNNIEIELESSVYRYNISNLIKKEIDIDVEFNNTKYVIELKYIRDKGSFNIGMYKFCEDIKFIEQLIENKIFDKGYAVLFTTIQEVYSKPSKQLNPKNIENLNLYKAFRELFEISGNLSIKTGKLNESLYLKGKYKLNWLDFNDNIKVCLIEITN
jgi:hypothetical protein